MSDAADFRAHGGRLVARALKSRGISHLFTLSGGHLFSIYDGCREEGIEIVDVRHEQSAVFAAEGFAKATRNPGACALTAGPGVTNGISPIANAQFNRSPVVVLGGRAPASRWGSGSLQEFDHIPVVESITRSAITATSAEEIPEVTARAIDQATAAPTGPTFVDYPLDVVFMEAEAEVPDVPADRAGAPAENVEQAAELLAGAERPVIMAGTGLYWERGEEELRSLAESLGAPVFLNGMGRGCLPADHELCFSRARGKGLKEADVALAVGLPLDFRLGFGGSFGEQTKLVWLDCAQNELTANRKPDVELVGDIAATLAALERDGKGDPSRTEPWVTAVREEEEKRRADEQAEFSDDRAPLHPMRIYGELAGMLDRNAIVIGDGGDFVSYAGKVVETYEPGCWMDPGPFGCLGGGPGQAIGAKLAHPDRQVVLLLGDGAVGFSGIEFDTMARLGIGVVSIIGNNGIWALEKHPMEFLYGYSVAADLAPGRRYDEMAAALGCEGALVERPDQLRPALEAALASDRPSVVNVLTDPAVVYPRKAVLA